MPIVFDIIQNVWNKHCCNIRQYDNQSRTSMFLAIAHILVDPIQGRGHSGVDSRKFWFCATVPPWYDTCKLVPTVCRILPNKWSYIKKTRLKAEREVLQLKFYLHCHPDMSPCLLLPNSRRTSCYWWSDCRSSRCNPSWKRRERLLNLEDSMALAGCQSPNRKLSRSVLHSSDSEWASRS